MADEMPANRDGDRLHLWQSLLNPVLADISKPSIPGRLYGVRPVGFGDGDDRDRLAMTATSLRRLDLSAHLSKSVREVGKRHNVPIYRRLQSESREAATTAVRGARISRGQLITRQ